MREYPKIQTLFVRDPSNPSRVVEGQFARPEFGLINRWRVTEKIHGTNVRLDFRIETPDAGMSHWVFTIGGRTARAQLSIPQHDFLTTWAGNLLPQVQAQVERHAIDSMTLYGELFGKGVQKEGAWYNPDGLSIAFFDALVNDKVWLGVEAFDYLRRDLGLPVANTIGWSVTTNDIVWQVKENHPKSTHAANDELHIEGIVARPVVDLYNAKGERVMFKLKGSDFGHSMRS